ncbi:hypothetical protein ACIQNG_19405 [Streptomyces sp. NPDC091377]|uniref:hypothetical protein n=1 Tax=unclassified Streptomyces TaxID=2593676 RepID=UPI003800F7E2
MTVAQPLTAARAWLRIAVLLLALLVPGAHTAAHALPVAASAAVGEHGGTTAEYDVPDTALRTTRATRQPVTPPRPAPPVPSPGRGGPGAHHAPPKPSYTLPCLRSVVLRC